MLWTNSVHGAWMWVYNNQRPHSSLGYLPPVAYLLKYGKHPTAQEASAVFPHSNRIIAVVNSDWKSIVLDATNKMILDAIEDQVGAVL